MTGRFDKFSGTFSYDEKNPDASKVKIEIDTTSVDTNFAERDKHLRGGDLLDIDMFPTATFESTSVKSSGPDKAVITGKLTLHGETKDDTIEAERVGGGKTLGAAIATASPERRKLRSPTTASCAISGPPRKTSN